MEEAARQRYERDAQDWTRARCAAELDRLRRVARNWKAVILEHGIGGEQLSYTAALTAIVRLVYNRRSRELYRVAGPPLAAKRS
jgi:hypothetical protein